MDVSIPSPCSARDKSRARTFIEFFQPCAYPIVLIVCQCRYTFRFNSGIRNSQPRWKSPVQTGLRGLAIIVTRFFRPAYVNTQHTFCNCFVQFWFSLAVDGVKVRRTAGPNDLSTLFKILANHSLFRLLTYHIGGDLIICKYDHAGSSVIYSALEKSK